MYFLYIYITMRETESRILLISYEKLSSQENSESLLSLVTNTIKDIDNIDNDITLMGVCEHIDLKTRKHINFKSASPQFFHKTIMENIHDITGTEFLIFNN